MRGWFCKQKFRRVHALRSMNYDVIFDFDFAIIGLLFVVCLLSKRLMVCRMIPMFMRDSCEDIAGNSSYDRHLTTTCKGMYVIAAKCKYPNTRRKFMLCLKGAESRSPSSTIQVLTGERTPLGVGSAPINCAFFYLH